MQALRKAVHRLATSRPVTSAMAFLSRWAKHQTIVLTIGLVVAQRDTLVLAVQRVWTSHGADSQALGVLVMIGMLPATIAFFWWMQRTFSDLRLQAG